MQEDKVVKKIEEGPPIYMESLMTLKEWKERMRLHPNTSHEKEPRSLVEFKAGEFKCRYRMGLSPTTEEATSINDNLAYIKANYVPKPKD